LPGYNKAVANINKWLPRNDSDLGIRSPHFWIIAPLTAFITFLYYVDQTPLAGISPFNTSFFSGVHDIHRTLFLIPVVYSALVFRVRGSLIISSVFLCVVLPRALLFSPYPDPLLRPLFFVSLAVLISLLVATQLNRIESERRALAELKAAYQKLEESQEQLIQAEKLSSLGQMAASIAHEVNNPLAGILAYTQLLIREMTSGTIPPETAINYLSKIELETNRSSKLIRNLLDFARQSPPSLRLTDVNEAISRALELTTHSANLKHIKVAKELNDSLPSIMADSDQLHQVFINLIMNAIQAMPKGGNLIIRTSVDDSCIKIEIQDNGCGIPPENIQKLFVPFFSTKKEVKGVGLGLPVVYGIIERHNGKIEVRSKEGYGSIFTIYLPLYQEENGGKG